jgi:excisionase family DNA binding protein
VWHLPGTRISRRRIRASGVTAPGIAAALVAELDDAALDTLAERLAPRLARRLPVAAPEPDGWLDTKGAASYLGITTNALYKLTAARAIPFEQDGPGCKCWFKRSDLDAWRRCERIRPSEICAPQPLPNRFQTVESPWVVEGLAHTKTPPERGFSKSG